MKKIALTGSTGLLGSRIIEKLSDRYHFIPVLHKEINLNDKDQVYRFIKDTNFDTFLHLAAYTNVDKAEQEVEQATKLNTAATRLLYETVAEKNKQFIYISTDFVFDGKTPPFYEDSKPNPISVYGSTKFEGEKAVSEKAMIIRLAYPYRSFFEQKKDFVRVIKSLLEKGTPLKMVTDSTITPTFIDDFADGIAYLFENFSNEIFHIVGSDSLSPFEAGKKIATTFNLNTELIQPITYKEYFAGKAKRPQFSEIKSRKNSFQPMKSFEEGLVELKKTL